MLDHCTKLLLLAHSPSPYLTFSQQTSPVACAAYCFADPLSPSPFIQFNSPLVCHASSRSGQARRRAVSARPPSLITLPVIWRRVSPPPVSTRSHFTVHHHTWPHLVRAPCLQYVSLLTKSAPTRTDDNVISILWASDITLCQRPF